MFGRVLLAALTRETVLSAFSATGIHPYNPNVITPDKLGPSTANSVRGTFPQKQSVTTRTVVAAFSTLPRTAFDNDAETHLPPRSPAMAIDPSLETQPPRTPSRRRPLLDLDPSLYTPSKRIRTLNAALINTTSASYLVSEPRITSELSRGALKENEPVLQAVPQELHEPEWSLLSKDTTKMSFADLQEHAASLTANFALAKQHLIITNAINEDNGAQLVIQHLHMNKLTESLHGKENKEPSTRSQFPSGHGRVLTDENFVLDAEADSDKRASEKDAKEQRKVSREARKVRKAEIEEIWKRWMDQHERALTAWETECADLRASGTRPKDLPKRPKKPLRKELPALEAEVEAEQDEHEDEEDTW